MSDDKTDGGFEITEDAALRLYYAVMAAGEIEDGLAKKSNAEIAFLLANHIQAYIDGWSAQYMLIEAAINRLDPPEKRKCIKCGCVESDCHQCIEATGEPCWWVAPGKCSRCFDKDGNPKESEAK